MQHKRNNGRLRVLAGPYLFAILATLGAPSASAQDTAPGGGQVMARAAPPVAGQRTAPTTAKRYFIDFRSRSALSYGHTFAVYGRLNAQGKIIESHVAG